MKILVTGGAGFIASQIVDRYIELTSLLGIKKVKQLPSRDLEEQVYTTISKEVNALFEESNG